MAAGLPSGQFPLQTRLREIELAVQSGATEIDVVINRSLALAHRWHELFLETNSESIFHQSEPIQKTFDSNRLKM